MNRDTVIINPEAPEPVLRGLAKHDIEVLPVPPCREVAPPLQGHPDLQLFIHHETFLCYRGLPTSFTDSLRNMGEVIISGSSLGSRYPEDIAFNVASTGAVAFHRADRTDTGIRKLLTEKKVPLLDVPQGYSKCSTCIVSERHIITADDGIHRTAINAGIDSLLISAGNIDLPGYSYGFIGGATGLRGDTVFFTGSFDHHPDAKAINDFILNAGKKIILLSEAPLIDLGSLFFIQN